MAKIIEEKLKRRYKLAEDSFQYNLLVNELFYLREFVSLIEFDPAHRNDSENFDRFLKDNKLSLDDLDEVGELSKDTANDKTDSIPAVRKKRNLRGTTTSSSNGTNVRPSDGIEKSWLNDINQIVDEKYDELINIIGGGATGASEGSPKEKIHNLTKKNIDHKKKNGPSSSSSKTAAAATATATSTTKQQTVKNETIKQETVDVVPSKSKNRSKKITNNVKIEDEVDDTIETVPPLKLIKNSSKRKNGGKASITSENTDNDVKNIYHDYTHNDNINNNDEDDDNDYGNNDDDYDFYFTSSSDEDTKRPLTKRQRLAPNRPHINLIVHPPNQTITNPGHVIKQKYNNLSEYLDSFKSMDEDITIEEYNKYIDEQREVVGQIRKGLESGALKYDPVTDSLQPITEKDTRLIQSYRPPPISYMYKEQNLQTHQDHLINQGIYMSKLLQSNKKARISRARKVSQMIEQHFRHIAGAEERKLKEEEKQRKALARTAMQAVKRRWTLAEKAFRVLKKDEEEELRRIQGKKHLSKVLEQSSQLLGAQLNQQQDDSEVSSIDNSKNESDLSSSESNNDDFLTSSDEEIEQELETSISEKSNTVDEALTTEELKLKYRELENVKSIVNTSEGNDITTQNESESDSVTTEESSENDELEEDEVSVSESKNIGLGSLFENTASGEESESDESVDFKMGESDADDMNISESEDETMEKSPTPASEKSEFKLGETDPVSVVEVPTPPLLRGTLRIYQKQGLNWLASLYNNKTNGILADEMGLGKTIQTISLLTYLACEKQNWGPHLIVVPTSVLLNWEMEFKKFAPGFKVLTYYGSPQQRKEKRKGWNKPDAFHVCIVSYQLVVQDQHSFKRKKWQYMILDEAHNIKNFRSTRWQALLNFNTQRRLLLTGTPLQNNIAELWSLLYFLMPKTITNGSGISGFADLDAFQQWFGRPVDKIIETGENFEQDLETKETVNKLHQVLRPYLLRRLKADVEKQMPAKYEHIVSCRLSKRQRFLYDDFMARAQTKATLASGNFMSIVNCLMQLRKVCNHPDLFEVRPVLSSFCIGHSVAFDYTDKNRVVENLLSYKGYKNNVNLNTLNMVFTNNERLMTSFHSRDISKLKCIEEFTYELERLRNERRADIDESKLAVDINVASEFFKQLGTQKFDETISSLEMKKDINILRCDKKPVYGSNLIKLLDITDSDKTHLDSVSPLIEPLQTKILNNKKIIETFAVITPPVVTLDMRKMALGLNGTSSLPGNSKDSLALSLRNMENPLHLLQTKLTIAFPDKSLLQYDCGKLQKLAILLQQLKDNGHRALIFTQMTKVLDILEQFLNYHGYLYMRLDGATKIEDRQILTERFNNDPRVTVFILSSRSGGLGINLTGADTVIFYDSDWNPAMDKQCQDRCHRIGQTRDVHIYRFVSEHTIESNILKKANQKRQLDNVIIQKGQFTTDYFSKLSVRDLLGADATENIVNDDKPLLEEGEDATKDPRSLEKMLAQAEDEDDIRAANMAMKEVEIDNEDFTEEIKNNDSDASEENSEYNQYEGTRHIEEYMLSFIAEGYYF
ncbi:hypothetical protein Kpol_1055p13 [Vanderwaltozyma polyspora DSM 70294]|uniref:Helicase SWR1 n=1 Tax=Vanderwaltozyma polyspora (strain ATCC 22028 / DSM 70294 / BCRC 21397 / CBS 2163 / NBRC 10782 / NRRL Y-8283 / UCD 57-17) TaxID=436907 RepID=A7TG87_VANPO|nr:uncharacterized protein Kpol_1055p13 [Vanderwaltozyma polyspora DSM 70294]EDO18657.1 hypothetical protein Kpol_1055p13 [Vanderwaltozyma polyspora DSM 70294]